MKRQRLFLSIIAAITFVCTGIHTVQATDGKPVQTMTSAEDSLKANDKQKLSGGDNTFVIKADGSLWAWGGNAYGQLSYTPVLDKTVPVKIMQNVAAVSARDHVLAVTKDGWLWAWGRNNYGQVGIKKSEKQTNPVLVLTGVTAVSTGDYHSMALQDDGSLWTWGNNYYGQLGNGTNVDSDTPRCYMNDVVGFAAGNDHCLAVKKDGSVWAWGRNDCGQIGNNTKTHQYTPVKIMDDASSVSAGYNFSLAVKKDGSIWAWGKNDRYQLGDNTIVDKSQPVKLSGPDNVYFASAGYRHSLVLRNDGSLWSFGGGTLGQLGLSKSVDVPVPTKVMEDVSYVSANVNHSLIVKADGSLWTCGSNSNGQLGFGTVGSNSYENTPTKIMEAGAVISPSASTGAIVRASANLLNLLSGEIGTVTVTANRAVTAVALIDDANHCIASSDVYTEGGIDNHIFAIKWAPLHPGTKKFYVCPKQADGTLVLADKCALAALPTVSARDLLLNKNDSGKLTPLDQLIYGYGYTHYLYKFVATTSDKCQFLLTGQDKGMKLYQYIDPAQEASTELASGTNFTFSLTEGQTYYLLVYQTGTEPPKGSFYLTTSFGECDFSEFNMATATSDVLNPGRGFTLPIPNNETALDTGGFNAMAIAYLAGWQGALLESHDPYPTTNAQIRYNPLPPDNHVQEILFLPSRADALDNDAIKSAIIKFGGVSSGFMVNHAFFTNNDTNYYMPESAADGSGHAITIVGWDDAYGAGHFIKTPPGNGAFICKNSWGSRSGDNGFFYISYYDKGLGYDTNTVFNNVETATNYNKIYQYDPLGYTTTSGYNNQAFFANVFTTSTAKESLSAVSFYTLDAGISYEVYAIKSYTDANSLKNIGAPLQTGTFSYAGYHTVSLDTPIALAQSSSFAVVVKLAKAGQMVKTAVEMPYTYASNARANQGESFISGNGTSWLDMTSVAANTNVCLKAFTETTDSGTNRLVQAIDNAARPYTDNTVYSLQDVLQMTATDLNPRFVDYINHNGDNTARLRLQEDQSYGVGLVPSPILTKASGTGSARVALPAQYDLRDQNAVTSVKNQGAYDDCWAFAAYGSLESCFLKQLSPQGVHLLGDNADFLQLNFTDADGHTLTHLTADSLHVTGKIIVPETAQAKTEMTAIVVVKKKDGTLLHMAQQAVPLWDGIGNVDLSLSLPDNTAGQYQADGCFAEVYVWDSLPHMQSYRAAEVFQ